jgi:hypothetical protein
MWKNIVQPDRTKKKIQRTRIASWIPTAISKCAECVILIVFSMLQLLHENASMFSYTHFACRVISIQMSINISKRKEILQ